MGEVQCLDCSRSCARQQILAKLLRATRASKFWIKFWKIRVWAKADMALLLAQVPRAASANRALVVAEHERRLDHVGERRHLCVTEYQLEQREDTLGSRRVGSERADGGTSRRPRGPDGLFTLHSPRVREICQKFACLMRNLPERNLPMFQKKYVAGPTAGALKMK